MSGEKNLDKLLKTMQPVLHDGEFVFCTVDSWPACTVADIVCFFREDEGLTLVLQKDLADRLNLPYSFVAAWVTLTVHSALDAVGLTAAVATALTENGISCNVIAAFYHDHIFVAHADGPKAVAVLEKLSHG